MNIQKLIEILDQTARPYRKGEIVKTAPPGIEVYHMPHVSTAARDIVLVDCHFIVVGVDPVTAEEHRKELIDILDTYPEYNRLVGGPSYIEVGAAIGSQDAALRLFALGQVLKLWAVITPATMKIFGDDADELAGRGMVMISGYCP